MAPPAMRIFLLPISTRRALIYYERAATSGPSTEKSGYTVSWATNTAINKANSMWASWERAEGGWKKHLTGWGNKMLSRIPYEEWGLKTIPPLTEKRRKSTAATDVVYPKMYMREGQINAMLEKLVQEREGLHRKRLVGSIVAMPFTAPFMIIPIIPNIPFFYCVFRAYSHWKALKGTQHLAHLLSNSLLHPTPSAMLDEAYTAGLMYPTRAQSRAAPRPTPQQLQHVSKLIEAQTNGGEEDVMVLQRWNGKLIAERFKLPEMEVEIERAVEQVERQIKQAEELREEKEEIERKAGAARPGQTRKDMKNAATKEKKQR